MVLRRPSSSSAKAGGYVLGVVFIVLVACIWAGASVLIQYIYADLSFESPFVLTFVCTALFSVYLPGVLCLAKLGLVENPAFRDHAAGGIAGAAGAAGAVAGSSEAGRSSSNNNGGGGICYTPISGRQADGLPLRAAAVTAGALGDDDEEDDDEEEEDGVANGVAVGAKPPLWSHVRTMRVSAVVFPLFFVANFAYNLSLAHTSVTSNTIISCTASLWTFLFSTCYGLERFSWAKMAGLLLSMGGTVLVGLADRRSGTADTVAGDALCLFAAVMYGVYTTALRVLVPDDAALSFQLLFGYVGALALLTLLPVALVLAKAAPHVFAGFTPTVLGFIVVNGLCDNVLSDYLWARSIVLTSPTVATLGLSLTIPLAFLSDAAMGKLKGGAGEVLGALAVAGGFFLVSWKGKGEAADADADAAAAAAAAMGADAAGGGSGGRMGAVEQGERRRRADKAQQNGGRGRGRGRGDSGDDEDEWSVEED